MPTNWLMATSILFPLGGHQLLCLDKGCKPTSYSKPKAGHHSVWARGTWGPPGWQSRSLRTP